VGSALGSCRVAGMVRGRDERVDEFGVKEWERGRDRDVGRNSAGDGPGGGSGERGDGRAEHGAGAGYGLRILDESGIGASGEAYWLLASAPLGREQTLMEGIAGRTGFTGEGILGSDVLCMLSEAGKVKRKLSGVYRTNDGNLPYARWPPLG